MGERPGCGEQPYRLRAVAAPDRWHRCGSLPVRSPTTHRGGGLVKFGLSMIKFRREHWEELTIPSRGAQLRLGVALRAPGVHGVDVIRHPRHADQEEALALQ